MVHGLLGPPITNGVTGGDRGGNDLHVSQLNLADAFVTFLAILGPQKVLLASPGWRGPGTRGPSVS